MNQLPEEHIEEGNFIWYHGATSTGSWSCPAQIIDVDKDKRTFRVISLDDMEEQKQVYSFDVGEHTPASRLSMRPFDKKRTSEYVQARVESSKRTLERLREKVAQQEQKVSELQSFLLKSRENVPKEETAPSS